MSCQGHDTEEEAELCNCDKQELCDKGTLDSLREKIQKLEEENKALKRSIGELMDHRANCNSEPRGER